MATKSYPKNGSVSARKKKCGSEMNKRLMSRFEPVEMKGSPAGFDRMYSNNYSKKGNGGFA